MLLMLRTPPSEPRGGNRAAGRVGRGIVLGFVLAAVIVPAIPAGATPLDDAKAKVAAAQRAADAAGQRYEAAVTKYEGLGVQIEKLQAQIKADRARAAELRAHARERAVAAYEGRNTLDGEGFLSGGDPLDQVRREKLLERTKAREDREAAELKTLTHDLEDQRAALQRKRDAEKTALARAQAQQQQVESQLSAAQQALNQLEAYLRKIESAQKAQADAAAVARSASNRAGGGGGGATNSSGMICPIRGPVTFVDSWGAPRHQGPHQGVDLMSPRGTPNVATVSGSVRFKSGSTSGNGAYLSGDNGTLYYYFHLDHWEGGPRHVAQGEVIGYTGNTGDASGGATHTHFEVHPGGGAAVNPYPYVRPIC